MKERDEGDLDKYDVAIVYPTYLFSANLTKQFDVIAIDDFDAEVFETVLSKPEKHLDSYLSQLEELPCDDYSALKSNIGRWDKMDAKLHLEFKEELLGRYTNGIPNPENQSVYHRYAPLITFAILNMEQIEDGLYQFDCRDLQTYVQFDDDYQVILEEGEDDDDEDTVFIWNTPELDDDTEIVVLDSSTCRTAFSSEFGQRHSELTLKSKGRQTPPKSERSISRMEWDGDSSSTTIRRLSTTDGDGFPCVPTLASPLISIREKGECPPRYRRKRHSKSTTKEGHWSIPMSVSTIRWLLHPRI